MANGVMAKEVMAKGVMADGVTANGVTANGVMPNGVMANGVMANGVMADGVMADGVMANGVRTLYGSRTARYTPRMPRAPRTDVGGLVYHVLNRANARAPLFDDEADYRLFTALLAEERAQGGNAPARLVPDAQPLASRALAARRRRSRPLRAPPDPAPYPGLARPSRHPRPGPSLPGPLQGVPGPGRRASAHRLPLRRAQPAARRPGRLAPATGRTARWRSCAAGAVRGCSTPGRARARRAGPRPSTGPRPRRSSKPCAARCSAAPRSAPPPG